MKLVLHNSAVYRLTNMEFNQMTAKVKAGIYPNFQAWLKRFRGSEAPFLTIDFDTTIRRK